MGNLVWFVQCTAVWSGLVLKDSQDYLVSEYLEFITIGSSDDS